MPEIVELKGIGPVLAKACAKHGYGSVETIAAAKLGEFVLVPGISHVRAQHLIEAARSLLDGGPAAEAVTADAGAGSNAKNEPTQKDCSKKKKRDKKKSKNKKKNKKSKKNKKKIKNKKQKGKKKK